MTAPSPIVGIVGGGQLARMTHQAAIGLGIEVVVLTDDPHAPAVAAGAAHCPGRPDQLGDLVALAERCDVVTLDHERAPAPLLAELAAAGHRVAPGPEAALVGQDKAAARRILAPHGVAVAPWRMCNTVEQLAEAAAAWGWPLVAKLPRGGYDGRGVWMLHSMADTTELPAFELLADIGDGLLVEPKLAFERELSVIVVRNASGETVAYPPLETVQADGQCREVLLPARVPPATATAARHLAVTIAHTVALVGTLAVELFDTADGLLLNELATRPHNSGHLTIEACATSQFENHLRAVLDLPLGATDALVPAAAMCNVVGGADGADPFTQLQRALAVPGAHVHRYAKTAVPNRKLGHITATGPDLPAARATALRAAEALNPELITGAAK